ncbi:STAS domain-containing protein [Telmatobacter bradus]|uniref:STAS domain-containing protein n=1 Tax=Telmatobacter bradus TaxID=474953 RepID=UPI003B43C92E
MSTFIPAEESFFAEESVVICTEDVLVRGREQNLLDELLPLVAENDVALSLERVQKIDAAGLGTLITIYRMAHEVGHTFRVVKPSRIVRGIICAVGFESALLYHNVDSESHSGPMAA